MKRLTMTLNEVCKEMRNAGFMCSPSRLADGIQSGRYPFGRLIHVSDGGRRTFEIFRVDFLRWLDSKTPAEERMRVNDGE